MGTLIVAIAIAVLCCVDFLPTWLGVTIILSSLIWALVAAYLYFKIGLFKFFYHDLLGWHTPDDGPQRYDGCSMHATCKYCKRDIMQDGQGNWF